MIFYIISIVGGDFLIILLNILLSGENPKYSNLYLIIAGVICAILIIALDGLLATICRKGLPEKWFDYKTKIHTASKKECKFYEFIGIKKWKDHILEVGMATTNFSKREVSNPKDIDYIKRFILECNYGSIVHLTNIFVGFVPCIFIPLRLSIPCGIINAFLSYLPYATLRYNSNRLGRLLQILEKKENKQA